MFESLPEPTRLSLAASCALLGTDGGITLDTRIPHHADPSDRRPEVRVTVGVCGMAVSLEDVTHALRSIPSDAWRPGRSYYWEGVSLSRCRRRAQITWGS